MARKDKEQSFPASKPDGFYSGPDSYYSKADDYQELNYEDLEGVAGGIKTIQLGQVVVCGINNEQDGEEPTAPITYGMIVK